MKRPGITCQAPTAGSQSGQGCVSMSQLGLGDLGPLQKGLDIFHLWVLGIKGHHKCWWHYHYDGVHELLSWPKTFLILIPPPSHGSEPRPSLPSSQAAASWPWGQDPGNSATTRERAGVRPHGGCGEERVRSPAHGAILEWGRRREVVQVRASQHQSLHTQDKAQVFEQPW